MSWKYSLPSYTTRDFPSTRETSQSKFGTTSKFVPERESRWSASNGNPDAGRTFRINVSQTDQSPIRTKASVCDNPSSVVQRLKEKYTSSSGLVSDNATKTPTQRPYGRSVTTFSLGSSALKPKQTSFDAETRRDYGSSTGSSNSGKSLTLKLENNDNRLKEPGWFRRTDSQISNTESKIYSPISPKSPTSPKSKFIAANSVLHDNERGNKEERESGEGEMITVVTRGTSPTPTTTSIYLRTKRADFGIQKKIHRPKIKPPFSHKETQTDKPEDSYFSRYVYSDINTRSHPWNNYGSSTFTSRFSRSSLKDKDSPTSPSSRSLSRESSSLELKSPESPKSPKELNHFTAKPPTSFRSTETIKFNMQKMSKEPEKSMPPRKVTSSLKLEVDDQANSPTPGTKKISPLKTSKSQEESVPVPFTSAENMNGNIVSDASSMSESSSEDETSSSDEEVERIKASETSFVKKSITNFLQNIPNVGVRKQPSCADHLNRSKSGVFHKLNGVLGPPPKITFNRVESGERAWWMDNNEPHPEEVVKILSSCCLSKQEPSDDNQGNGEAADNTGAIKVSNISSFLPDVNTNRFPLYLINRQFTTDLDWLKDSEDDKTNSVKWKLDGNNNISRTRGDTTESAYQEDNFSKTESSNCDSSPVSSHDQEPNGAMFINNVNTLNTWFRDNTSVAHDACTNIDKSLQNSANEVASSQILFDYEEPVDVTPGLRRRREQGCCVSPEVCNQDSNQQAKISNCEKFNGDLDNKKPVDFPTEMRERPVIHQNGVQNLVEDKTLEAGDMSNLISKAKAGLVKSKTKLDVRKSSSREMSPKHEIDLYWKELVDSLNRPLKLCDLDFTDLNTDDETDVFGNSRTEGEIPPPPPMLILPPAMNLKVPVPPSSMNPPQSRITKPPNPPTCATVQIAKNKKTVKLFWKEVKDEPAPPMNPPGVTLIWDELVKVNVDTQKLEQLFESRAKDVITKKQHEQNKSKEIIVLDHKRSNQINIGMTKLPPPRAIKTAILKMDSTVVNKEGIEKLLTMLPTEEERVRIQDAQSSNPDIPLGSAEQFLIILASINELEARLKLWAFKLDFENCEKEICEPLMDLKQGMEILKTNKTFRAILSTLLSVGNFLNGCDAKGFQIDYLSKVPEVKDTVQKHSLLHHLCMIVMEKFPESTDLYSEIGAVTRASKIDFDELSGSIRKIEEECKLSWNYLKMIAKHEGHTAMKVKMSDFLADCAERIIVLGMVHKRIMSRFHKFAFWLGIPMNRISIIRPNEIFKIISEFALEYRTTRERILQQIKKMNHREKNRSRGCLVGDVNDGLRKMNSKEAKDDAKLRQLLTGDSTYSDNNTATWRRHRKDTRNLKEIYTNNEDEIIETLIKTANQIPSHRPSVKDRRRTTKVYDRKC